VNKWGRIFMPVYSEADLVVPALVIIAENPNGITTSELLRQLRARLEPSGDDRQPPSDKLGTSVTQPIG
jgi:hypothetical protein